MCVIWFVDTETDTFRERNYIYIEREKEMGSKKTEGTSAPQLRDPYEVLCVSKDSTDQEIKTAYRKLALK